jgi:hypothetical protein
MLVEWCSTLLHHEVWSCLRLNYQAPASSPRARRALSTSPATSTARLEEVVPYRKARLGPLLQPPLAHNKCQGGWSGRSRPTSDESGRSSPATWDVLGRSAPASRDHGRDGGRFEQGCGRGDHAGERGLARGVVPDLCETGEGGSGPATEDGGGGLDSAGVNPFVRVWLVKGDTRGWRRLFPWTLCSYDFDVRFRRILMCGFHGLTKRGWRSERRTFWRRNSFVF